MAEYPEHEKLSAISDQSQAIGEFLDWLGSRGISLMTWREDLTDTRTVDPECKPLGTGPLGRDGIPDHKPACSPVRPVDGPASAEELYVGSVYYTRQHCTHWTAGGGDCCRCGKGRTYEVTGISAWTSPGKSTTGLLAEFFEIDLAKIEAEKRAMLASLRDRQEVA